MRRALVLSTTTILISGLLAPASLVATPSAMDVTLGPCDETTPVPPCVISVTVNGDTVDLPTEFDDPYHFFALFSEDAPVYQFAFGVQRNPGLDPDPEAPFSLDPEDVWEVSLNTGSIYPNETFSRGRDVDVERSGDAGSGHIVTFTMSPTRMALTADDSTCASTGDCGGSDSIAERLRTGVIEGWISDTSYREDPTDQKVMRGFDLAFNAEHGSSPLGLDYDTRSIMLDIANTHFEPDGVEQFIGHAQFTLPFPMLNHLYLMDDPGSLTDSAFQTTATGPGDPEVNVDLSHPNEVRVAIDDITFSKRTLRIKGGNVRPGSPRKVRAKRFAATKGRIAFKPARSRGSKVRGYVALCKRPGHKRKATGKTSPLVVSRLKPAKPYRCTVRARSRAGLGKAAAVKMPRRP